MTDQQLIDLLEQKTPEELSLEEIQLLRSRLAESPQLLETLLGQLQMEGYLAAALGRINLSPQQIVARAHSRSSPAKSSVIALLAFLVCLPLLLLVAAVAFNSFASRSDTVAQADREKVGNEGSKEKPKHEEAANDPKPAVAEAGENGASKSTGDSPATAKPPGATERAPAPPAVQPPPWQAALDQPGEPPPFEEVAFERFDASKALPQKEDLEKWFASAPGYNLRLNKIDTKHGPCGALEGAARLKSPWPENSALRLSLENYNRLKMHFFSGTQGVTLVYYEDQNYRWAAYATTREAGKATPKTWSITATDDQRAVRADLRHGGPIELRYHEGQLILSRGDIVLIAAAMPLPPQDVFFEGRATFLGIALVRSKGAPMLPTPETVAFDSEKPAALDWQASKPEIAKPEKLADGSVRFAADKAKERIHCYTALPAAGLNEVVFQLQDISPGSAVVLTRGLGEVREVLRFHRDKRSNQLVALLRSADDEFEREFEQPADKPVAVSHSDCWVKLLYGCGNICWWISSDGVHWAQPDFAQDRTPGNVTGIGLHLVANRPDTHITLKRIQLRELSGLASLAPAELRAKGIANPGALSLGQWQSETLAKKPADTDSASWLRACAIRTLGAGAERELAYSLLDALLADAAARKLPLDQQLAALHDAARMAHDLRDAGAMRVGLARRYVELGKQAFEEQGLPAWSSVRQHAMSVPIHTPLVSPWELEPPIRWESIQRAYAAEPEATLGFCQALRLFDQQRHSPLVDWAEALARRDLPNRSGTDGLVRMKEGWREPYIEELSKEAYNAATELKAVLDSEAWDDAASLVTSFDPESAPGVTPYFNDRQLLASLGVSVRLIQEDYPQLRETLGERFGPLSRLRIGQAIAAGDAASVELATVQFAGTEAAADAYRWLGDRALSSGWFDRAIAEYRRAEQIEPALAADIAPRIRLAAAMLGRDLGQPVTTQVRFNDLTMPPAEFEALVAEMKQRGNAGTLATSAAPQKTQAVPAAKRYDVHHRSLLDGPLGQKPSEEVGRRTNQFKVPWPDRQLATAIEGETMYVANRFQVAAYNLTNGQRLWQSQAPLGQMARAQDWALIAMKPLITSSHIFVRLLYGANPQLVCLERATGKLVWVAESSDREYLVSDPVIVQGQLVALGIRVEAQQQGLLQWHVFDPESGELQLQRELIRLNNTWGTRACCEVQPLEDGLIAVLGGATLSVGSEGSVRWVRKHVTTPAEEDPRWVLQHYQRPIVSSERIYITQPGVRTVDCLELSTGRKHWSTVLPEVVASVGLSGNLLIVRTESDLVALDQATGKTVWRRPAAEAHSYQLVDDKAVLLALREKSNEGKDQWAIRLTWLDVASGRPTATTVLPKLTHPDPRLGPLVPFKDRIFTFFGRGQHDPARDIVELVPAGEADRSLPVQPAGIPWQRRLPGNIVDATFRVLPDWQLLSGQEGDRTGFVADVHGEKDVCGIRSTAAWPVVLGRELSLPAGGRPRLRMRLGTDASQQWKVEVRFGDQLLKTEEIKDETHRERWKNIEVDLAPAAGRQGWLTIRAQSTSGEHVVWWKGAEVLF